MCLLVICMSYRKNVYLGLMPIFKSGCFLLLSFTSCLDIFNIKPQSVMLFANSFSHSVSCLFILFIVFFAVQKILSIIRSRLFVLGFISITLGGRSMIWLQFMSMFCLFFSKSFIVSGLTCRSLMHFEFIFVYGVKECSNSFLFHVAA